MKPGEPAPNPDLSESEDLGPFQVLGLEALVRVKLTAFGRKDQVHLTDMIGVGLIDATWPTRLPPILATGLQ